MALHVDQRGPANPSDLSPPQLATFGVLILWRPRLDVQSQAVYIFKANVRNWIKKNVAMSPVEYLWVPPVDVFDRPCLIGVLVLTVRWSLQHHGYMRRSPTRHPNTSTPQPRITLVLYSALPRASSSVLNGRRK